MIRPKGTVRVLTWNIHAGVGRDGVCDLRRIADAIRSWDPDIVALQEVDSRTVAHTPCAFTFLLETIGGHGVDAKSILAADGEYGQLLIARWPFARSEVHDISVPGREPRRAIEAEIITPSGPLHVIATHLGLSFKERRWQADKLASLADRRAGTAIVLGDFNDWMRGGAVRRSLRLRLPSATDFRTWPSSFPLMKLDQIFCRPEGAIAQSRRDEDAARYSDHLPVIADVFVEI